MSFQSRIGCWWVRLYVKRKPPGEPALVDFTRRRFRTPDWLVWLHSLGMKIERVERPVQGEWISTPKFSKAEPVVYYLHGGGYISGTAKSCRPITATLARNLDARVFALDYRLAPESRFPAGLDDAEWHQFTVDRNRRRFRRRRNDARAVFAVTRRGRTTSRMPGLPFALDRHDRQQ
jgi:hypothetical protein